MYVALSLENIQDIFIANYYYYPWNIEQQLLVWPLALFIVSPSLSLSLFSYVPIFCLYANKNK